MEWNIMDIKVRTENNYVVEVMASCKHTEGRGKSIVVHTSNFTGEPDQNFIPFEQLTKEEVLKCQDGYDGPSYWELFAQFYYADLTTPAYCRQYARPDHPFKTPGMICLSENGVWEVKK